jgi:prepilin-type processing-associated H-X9-DG protein
MKQLGTALLAYAQDYDERTPRGDPWWQGQGWAGQVYAYIKSTGVYLCPDDTNSAPSPQPNPPVYPVSYGRNANTTTNGPGVNISNFVSPANTVYLYEVFEQGQVAVTDPFEGGNGGYNAPASGYFSAGGWDVNWSAGHWGGGNVWPQATRHDGQQGANYLAVDGHVKFLHQSQVSWGGNAATSTTAPTGDSQTWGNASGTNLMKDNNGNSVTMTMSII